MSVAVTSVGEVDEKFGLRLREWRRRRGLSQAELGGDRFSGSYVSHVESGRRRATPEMIDYFARQLNLEPEALGDADRVFAAPVEASVLKVSGLAIRAGRAHTDHDFARAARLAAEAAELAKDAGLVDRWWFAKQQEAQALFEDGDYQRSYDVAVNLAGQESVAETTVLRLEALVLATRSARAFGNLGQAEELARQALQLATVAEWGDYRAEALIVLIGVLGELGRLDDARSVIAELVDLREAISSTQLRGVAYWVTGNVQLLEGDTLGGISAHECAGSLLRPEVDLRAWGRFYKATAQTRLQAGVTENVPVLLERARQAILLVGNASDRTELRLLEARLALAEGRSGHALSLAQYCLDDESLADAPHSRAEALELISEIEAAEGRLSEAADALVRAAGLFEEAGALKRSIAAWRAHAELVSNPERKLSNFLTTDTSC